MLWLWRLAGLARAFCLLTPRPTPPRLLKLEGVNMSRFMSLVIDFVAEGMPLEAAEHKARVMLYGFDPVQATGAE